MHKARFSSSRQLTDGWMDTSIVYLVDVARPFWLKSPVVALQFEIWQSFRRRQSYSRLHGVEKEEDKKSGGNSKWNT